MQLALTVAAVVLGVVAIVGLIGYAIDRSAVRHDRDEV